MHNNLVLPAITPCALTHTIGSLCGGDFQFNIYSSFNIYCVSCASSSSFFPHHHLVLCGCDLSTSSTSHTELLRTQTLPISVDNYIYLHMSGRGRPSTQWAQTWFSRSGTSKSKLSSTYIIFLFFSDLFIFLLLCCSLQAFRPNSNNHHIPTIYENLRMGGYAHGGGVGASWGAGNLSSSPFFSCQFLSVDPLKF